MRGLRHAGLAGIAREPAQAVQCADRRTIDVSDDRRPARRPGDLRGAASSSPTPVIVFWSPSSSRKSARWRPSCLNRRAATAVRLSPSPPASPPLQPRNGRRRARRRSCVQRRREVRPVVPGSRSCRRRRLHRHVRDQAGSPGDRLWLYPPRRGDRCGGRGAGRSPLSSKSRTRRRRKNSSRTAISGIRAISSSAPT